MRFAVAARARIVLVLVLMLLLAGCGTSTSLGVRNWDVATPDQDAARLDASLDDVTPLDADAPTDAIDETLPFVPSSELLGLESNAPSMGVDPDEQATHFRLYYRGLDGNLWFERRRSTTLARTCQTPLGHPPGVDRIAGQPAVANPYPVVIVPAATGENGRLELWSREQLPMPGTSCGHEFSAWQRLPVPRDGADILSSPAAVGVDFPQRTGDLPPAIWVAVLGRDGISVLSRLRNADAPWEFRRVLPALDADERHISRPALSLQYAATVIYVISVVERGADEIGRVERSLRQIPLVADSAMTTAEWIDLVTDDDPPVSAATSIDDGGRGQGVWLAYLGRSGHCRANLFTIDPTGGFYQWGYWRDLGRIAVDDLSGVFVAPLRNWIYGDAEIGLVSASRSLPRELRYLRETAFTWSTGNSMPWSIAPDGLR